MDNQDCVDDDGLDYVDDDGLDYVGSVHGHANDHNPPMVPTCSEVP